jgi:flagella basal body P-ring formation protein FlgA
MASLNDQVIFSFSALTTCAAWQLAALEAEAERIEREIAQLRSEKVRTSESRVFRFIMTLLAASLMTAAGAAAAHGAGIAPPAAQPFKVALAPSMTPSQPAPGSSPVPATPDYPAQVTSAITPLLPEGMRADGVTLGCKLPADATIKAVAPGFTRIESRGFMVEFVSGQRTIYCSATLNAERQMLVTAHDIQSGDAVSASDFKPQWVDAFSSATGSLDAFPSRGPYAATAFIRAGEPLYQNQIARPIAVRAGDLVTVIVKNGPITVRALLQSQSSVAVGETATVVNPTSGIPLMVTVTGPKMAELVLQ